ncbi:hypothetical protein [Frankia sp. R82]|uniref:hypothetical protein n=1 Tax=Frankia sp. R82 TaxID=2950553 RepID=UPI0020441733|nr:hypothetical protein [Frankia sp. R82]MCM3885452.1 hypothetical protein [Frankia sp. R82]
MTRDRVTGQVCPIGRARRTTAAGGPTRLRSVLHYFFTGLLVAMCVLIAWFAGYVVYKLYEVQR